MSIGWVKKSFPSYWFNSFNGTLTNKLYKWPIHCTSWSLSLNSCETWFWQVPHFLYPGQCLTVVCHCKPHAAVCVILQIHTLDSCKLAKYLYTDFIAGCVKAHDDANCAVLSIPQALDVTIVSASARLISAKSVHTAVFMEVFTPRMWEFLSVIYLILWNKACLHVPLLLWYISFSISKVINQGGKVQASIHCNMQPL